MPEAGHPDPAILRRRLRTELRKARDTAGMTQRDVAVAMDWSQSKLIRIESGAVSISTNDLRVLLGHYGADSHRTNALIDIARAARGPTRWSIYKDVATPEYIAFLGYEASASNVRHFEPLLIPGLLQTEDYARTVISVTEAHNPQKIDPLVDLRIERQELLVREPAVSFYFIMDEAAIRKVAGGRDIMRQQLRRLQKLAEYPNVTMRIVPFELGIYTYQRLPYTLLEFPDVNDGDVLYVENPEGEYLIRETPEEEGKNSPVPYMEAFFGLEQNTSREDTLDLLQDAINRLTTASPVVETSDTGLSVT